MSYNIILLIENVFPTLMVVVQPHLLKCPLLTLSLPISINDNYIIKDYN